MMVLGPMVSYPLSDFPATCSSIRCNPWCSVSSFPADIILVVIQHLLLCYICNPSVGEVMYQTGVIKHFMFVCKGTEISFSQLNRWSTAELSLILIILRFSGC
jgi:hypothetical protein